MRRDDGNDASVVEDGKEKSERKRQREKQRRSELTNAFDDLSALVLTMDNDDEGGNDGGARKKSRRLSGHNQGEDTGGMTRVDLINRALAIMKRLQQENGELKQSLSRSSGHDKNEVSVFSIVERDVIIPCNPVNSLPFFCLRQVMVMVPTLMPADEAAPPPAAAASSFRPPYMPFPPIPQQEYGGAQQSRYPFPPQQEHPMYGGAQARYPPAHR